VISDGALHVVAGFIGWLWLTICSFLPAPPQWVTDGQSVFGTIIGFLNDMGSWIPVPLAFTVAATVSAVWVVSITINIIRTIVSYATFGGGAT
jgi:hypothetical protein